ncbi:MAG: hypothetical protein ABSA23_05175 [Anaerolineales bacterium]|jgi:hypothetical protein
MAPSIEPGFGIGVEEGGGVKVIVAEGPKVGVKVEEGTTVGVPVGCANVGEES